MSAPLMLLYNLSCASGVAAFPCPANGQSVKEWPLNELGQVVCQHLDGPVDTLQNTLA